MWVVPFGRPPKNSTRPARSGHLHRLLLGVAARAGDDHDVGADPVGRLADRFDAILV